MHNIVESFASRAELLEAEIARLRALLKEAADTLDDEYPESARRFYAALANQQSKTGSR